MGSDSAILTAAAKLDLHGRTGAVAVDMESHAVGRVARDAGLPFLVVRVIADTQARSLPSWIMDGVDDAGHARPWAMAGRLLGSPGSLPALIGLGRDNAKAMACLRRVALIAGPGLAFLG